MKDVSLEIIDDTLKLKGTLNFQNVGFLFKKGCQWLNVNDAKVDLSEVTQSDSAGIALLIGLMNHAKDKNHSLQIINMPTQMRALADICGLNHLIEM